ncbi:hypothetical protein HPB50_012468 [Hyalomma asiaticum]|uniref:Uncharacterized protein n=1 Tax=Hyalomma asiaticum TaxID=266040 RepID=A0ACB7TH21_HYAAI|nr:hypothetical protein HPB50_012468 [Hyalomma asiaticum]
MPAPIQQPPVAAPLNYAEAVQRQQLQQQQPLPFRGVSQVSHVTDPTQPPVACTAPNAASPWRTRNNRPICFACRGVDHVARYCHRLAPGHTDARSQNNYVDRPHPRYESPDPQSNTSSRDYPQSGSGRSPSPRRRSLSPIRYLISGMALPYCVFLPLDLSTKHAIRTHGSLADWLHIWRSEAHILVGLSLLLWLWRLRVSSLLRVLAACTCSSGRGWSPSLALEAAASGVFSLWFQSMECIGVVVDGGLRKVLPQQWKMEQEAIVGLTTMRRVTFPSVLVSAAFLQHLSYALVYWRRALWEAYLHHCDAISVPAEARGSPPPRISRRVGFSGTVDSVEVTDRTPSER